MIGLGAMGSAVTRELAARGVAVTGIDRHHPPHVHGSSHGDTRVTRLATAEGPQYVPLVRRSHERWRTLEQETGETLFHQVGVLMISRADSPFITSVQDVAQRFGISHETLGADQLRERFAMFAGDDDAIGHLEPEGGYVRVEAAVAAQLALAARDGATLRLGETVTGWEASPAGVSVTLAGDETLHADRLVICAGPWLPEVVPELSPAFAVHRQLLHWFEIERGHESLAAMPVWIYDLLGHHAGARPGAAHGLNFYGFPAIDGPDGGLKLATEQYEVRHAPDDRQHPATEAEITAAYEGIVRDRLPWLGPGSVRTASCLYTCTADSHFVIDEHPEHPAVMVVSPCSGHGFKHSAAIGEAVAQTLAGEPLAPGVELAPFSLSRLAA